MIKILLVDDHEIIRTGIQLMLRDVKEMNIIGQADSGEEAIKLARTLSPDVVIMDINMPGIGGLEAILRISRNDPPPKILVVSTYMNDIIPSRLINFGVSGYLTKQADKDMLIAAIKKINSGERYIEPILLEKALTLPNMEHASESDKVKINALFTELSQRELQILLMVARGMKATEIGKKLFLTNKTVNGYRNDVLKKLGVKTDVEAARIAIKYGLVDVDAKWH